MLRSGIYLIAAPLRYMHRFIGPHVPLINGTNRFCDHMSFLLLL